MGQTVVQSSATRMALLEEKVLPIADISFQLISSVGKIDKKLKICTSSVSPELLQAFARILARVAFLRNITLLAMN